MPKYDRRLFHFGINLGTQITGLAVRTIPDLRSLQPDTVYSVNPDWAAGFTMGIESNLRLNNNFDLRFTPTMILSSRRLFYELPKNRVDKFEIECTMVEFPIYIKFKTDRINNFRAYMLTGGKYTFDIANKVKAENASDYPVKLREHDVSIEAGFGMDFYLPYFKFSMQVKGTFGMLNLHFPENNKYNRAIEGMYSRGIFIQFLFE